MRLYFGILTLLFTAIITNGHALADDDIDEGIRPMAECPVPSPDGKSIAFVSDAGPGTNIWILLPDAGVARPLTNWANSVEGCPDWSPDGEKIIFSSNNGGQFDIWVTDVTGTTFSQLTEDSGSNTQPHYSPDGLQVVFLSNRTGKRELWLMQSDSSNQHLIGLSVLNINDPSWSPSGNEIAYVGCRLIGCSIYAVSPDGSAPRAITSSGPFNQWHLDWGPMGITFDSDVNGSLQLWSVSSDGFGRTRTITSPAGTGDFLPHWDRTTGGIFFTRSGETTDQPSSSIWFRDSAGNEEQLTRISGFFRNGDLNGDGITNCADLTIVKNAFGSKRGYSNYDSRADVNGDGVVNIYDLSAVSRNIPAGIKCN